MIQRTKEENKALIEKYPFLLPRNVWTDEVVRDYDYSFTLLDDLEDGWDIRFGIPFCEDLKEMLIKYNYLNKYRIIQIKEKWGYLHWYDNGVALDWMDHMRAWEYISAHTCKKCGKFPVPMRDDGWVSPWCDDCFGSWHKEGYTKEEKKKWTNKDMGTDRLVEFLELGYFEDEPRYIDMKPFYEKISWEYHDLISKEELEQYHEYKKLLEKYENKWGRIKAPQIIPYEIQELNPFKEG